MVGTPGDSKVNLDLDNNRQPPMPGDEKENGSQKNDNVDLEKASNHSVNPVSPDDGSEASTPADPNIVTWDGPDDPENPMNWPRTKKIVNVSTVSLITFLTPLASSMFAPGVPEVMEDFKSTNLELSSFVVSVYLLGYAFGPLIIAPCSEMYGRMPVYHTCNVLFVVFTVACAVATDLDSLIVFRFFEGIAGSSPLTIGAGTLADMIAQEKRGAAMAAWALGPLLGPVVGPVAGGYLTEAAGWRWTFWVLAIAGGVVTFMTAIFMRESYAPTLLKRKTNRMIKETGNQDLKSALDSGLSPKDLFKHSIVRPTKMLIFSPIVLILSLFVAIVYGYLYLLFTTITMVFEGEYNFDQGSVGLTYLGIGIGSLLGLFILGSVSDRILKRMTAKHGVAKPEFRLPPLIPGAVCVPIGLFWYGWTAETHQHYILPIAGTLFVGIGMITSFMTISTYLVDAYTIHAASAMAANTVLRSLIGALLPLAGRSMYAALGLGWGNSLLAFIALAMVPLAALIFMYGERIRTSKRFEVQF
ncbi:hypothetical protein FQN54_006512 [Arachnomyces sp. PD_36]|nr:hypothetical protein FQN54_006512 [Arachnomyces sp. PD_36]